MDAATTTHSRAYPCVSTPPSRTSTRIRVDIRDGRQERGHEERTPSHRSLLVHASPPHVRSAGSREEGRSHLRWGQRGHSHGECGGATRRGAPPSATVSGSEQVRGRSSGGSLVIDWSSADVRVAPIPDREFTGWGERSLPGVRPGRGLDRLRLPRYRLLDRHAPSASGSPSACPNPPGSLTSSRSTASSSR